MLVADESAEWLWLAAYGIYLFVNIYLLFSLHKKDLFPIKVWFPFTTILLILRVINFNPHKMPINCKLNAFFIKKSYIHFILIMLSIYILLSNCDGICVL